MGAVGAQLLSELDHALRITKEEPNIWFGGMIVIFAGDFHQHSPLSETPLYQPISNTENQSNTEISKWLGQLAWKSIDAVVELKEQKCMEFDLKYSNAVNNLWLWQCTPADVELFNSHLIESNENPNGIDMGLI